MPELLGIGLPIWALAILFLLSNKTFTDFIKRVLSPLGINLVKDKQAELEIEQWMRQRADWSSDKAFTKRSKVLFCRPIWVKISPTLTRSSSY